jgi:hypothetical protein
MIIPRDPAGRLPNAESRIAAALSEARKLIRYGMPVFPGRVDDEGNPDRTDLRWSRWNKYPADDSVLDRYRPGEALAALCGITFDVIDIDPRNGGRFSFNRMSEELGDMGPVVYGKVKTPSGGIHLYVAAMGIGSHNNFMPGIDLKGGYPDGSGRGFVFLPPTIRPVKGLEGDGGVIAGEMAGFQVRMGTYRWTEPIQPPGGDSSSEELTSYISAAVASREMSASRVSSSRREATSKLREDCLSAPEGGQRAALLRYVHELERKGTDRADMLDLLRSVAKEMRAYNERRPWYPAKGRNPDAELIALFHKEGTVIPDATPAESELLSELSGPSVAKAMPKGLRSFDSVDRTPVQWLWMRYLSLGDITMLDGDAGNGKSLVTLDIASRVSRGAPMPDGSRCGIATGGNVLLLAPEDSDAVTAGRLEAAGADLRFIHRPSVVLRKEKRGENAKAYVNGDLVTLPDNADIIRDWIINYTIRLIIIDPITAFLGEKVNTNNDSSVRKALSPLTRAMAKVGCAALLIRHYNKNAGTSAQHRGGGSVAFGAVSRVHMVSGVIPVEDRGGIEVPSDGEVYGITIVKSNNIRKREEYAFSYTIEDSDIVADTDGNMAPRIRWLGAVTTTPDKIASPNAPARHGPSPMIQEEIVAVMTEMFAISPVWDAKTAEAEIRAAGISANKETISKARIRMGVTVRPRHEKGKIGAAGWDWYAPAKQKISEDG